MSAFVFLAQTSSPMDELGALIAIAKLIAVLVGFKLWEMLRMRF
jgi:hypothetical protein